MPSHEAAPVRRRHDPDHRGLASDNYAGVHPAVLAALEAANGGHQGSYGADAYSAALAEIFRAHFGDRCEVYPVFNGTGANVVSLQAMTERWDAVICAESAHVNVDECGAPERVGGLKLLSVPVADGKLTPEHVISRLSGVGDEHRAQPRVVSVTESTELGTCYSVDELVAVCEAAHRANLFVHMDGARISNAAASLGVSLGDLTSSVGVDVLSFGGTKNGLMLADAVVVLNAEAVSGIRYLRKAAMQLASKMRFIAVQFEALLSGDMWLSNARRANDLAARLASGVRQIPGVVITQPVQANAVFAVLPTDVADRLRPRYGFYTWNEATGEVRLMTAFDTTEDDVDEFVGALRTEVAGHPDVPRS
ncbi:MAG: low specificity L-threonine aldolase [Acidimicrobiales bacterium]|jgi:threonine aldolase